MQICIDIHQCFSTQAILLPRDIWQRLETFLAVTNWGGGGRDKGEREVRATGIQWIEADALMA